MNTSTGQRVTAHSAPASPSRRQFLQLLSAGAGGTALSLLAANSRANAPLRLTRLQPDAIRTAASQQAGNAAAQGIQLPPWGDAANWNWFEYYETIQAGRRQTCKTVQSADIDGDGRDELFARGPAGLLVTHYDPASGQWLQLPDGPAYSDTESWDQPCYFETIQTADIDGDGAAELLARDASGIEAWKYDPINLTWNQLPRGPGWADQEAWNQPENYMTIQCGDIDADGSDELVARYLTGVVAWRYEPDIFQPFQGTWKQLPYGPGMSDFYGWSVPQRYETIQLADLFSGVSALLARSDNAVEAWWFDPTLQSWTKLPAGPAWSDDADWNQPSYFQTIQTADIDGDGNAELLGRDADGIQVWKFLSSENSWYQLPNGPAWSDAASWNQPQYFQTIQTADIDGDGSAELLARGPGGVEAWKYDPVTFTWNQLPAGPAWSDAAGWNQVQFYSTIQTARTLLPGDFGYTGDGQHTQAVLLGRDVMGMLTYRYDAMVKQWVQTSAPFPAFTGSQQVAYDQLDRSLRGLGANGNIRSAYNDETAPLNTWMSAMYTPAPTQYNQQPRPQTTLQLPSGISQEDWDAVTWQIYWEISWVLAVNDWYGNKGNTLITETYLGKDLTLQTVGDYLNLPPDDSSSVAMSVISLIANGAWAALGFPELNAGDASAVAGLIATASSAAATFMPNGGGSFQEAYDQLQGTLNASFGQVLTANGQIQFGITGGTDASNNYVDGDYGLLSAIGQQIQSTVWSWPSTTDSLVTTMQRAYAINCWQALIALEWVATYSDDTPPPGDFPSQYLYVTGSDFDDTFWLSNNCPAPASASLSALFDPVSAESPFPLNVPLADVYTGQNGWPSLGKLDCSEDDLATPPEPLLAPLGVEVQVAAVLTRHPITDEIVAAITLHNRGLTAATNVEIVGARLTVPRAGDRYPATSSLPTRHTRLATGRTKTLYLRYTTLSGASGRRAVLRVSGAHLGGTFHARLRVQIPKSLYMAEVSTGEFVEEPPLDEAFDMEDGATPVMPSPGVVP